MRDGDSHHKQQAIQVVDLSGPGSNLLDQEQAGSSRAGQPRTSEHQLSQFQALWINIGKCEGLINIGNRIPGK